MSKPCKAFVHVGLDDGSGDAIDASIETHGHALADLGVRSPASGEEMFRAALEMLHAHHAWGYRRAEVEGAWSAICRRAHRGKDTVVFSQALLAGARPEQVALLVDALAGFEVHVIVTVQAPGAWTVPGEPAHDLGSVLERWRGAVAKPERLHVIVADDRAVTWKRFGRVVGFGTSSLRVADAHEPPPGRPPHVALGARAVVLAALGGSWIELLAASEHHVVGDPASLVPERGLREAPEVVVSMTEHALAAALHEVERLKRRNTSLELRVAALEKKRAKLKRRLSSVA